MFSAPRRLAAALAAAALTVGLAGCSVGAETQNYVDGVSTDYVGSDGMRYKEFAPDERSEPISFGGVTELGDDFDSSQLHGQVAVVNFWYAACGPCRSEAPILEGTWQEFQDDDVAFLGINTRDQPETALSFSADWGITYPSLIDITTGEAKLAFAAVVPTFTPTTVVLDREGRVAARLIGEIKEQSILSTAVKTVLAEQQ